MFLIKFLAAMLSYCVLKTVLGTEDITVRKSTSNLLFMELPAW